MTSKTYEEVIKSTQATKDNKKISIGMARGHSVANSQPQASIEIEGSRKPITGTARSKSVANVKFQERDYRAYMKKPLVWRAPGQNCTGDLRIIGVLAVLMKDTVDSYLLYDPTLLKNKIWIIRYLHECRVNFLNFNQFHDNKGSKLKKYLDFVNENVYTYKEKTSTPNFIKNCNNFHSLFSGPYAAPILNVIEAHNLLKAPEATKLDVPELIGKDITKHIKKFREFLKIGDVHKDSKKNLVIWVKKKDEKAYHPEHFLSRTCIIEMIREMIKLKPKGVKINIKIRDDDTIKKNKYKALINEINEIKKDDKDVSLEFFNLPQELIPQYQKIGKHPENTLHFGGRSGHLEVMPFLGHKVLYYEETGNPETGRIYESLCTMTKGGSKVMERFQGIPQTRFGYAKTIISRDNTIDKNILQQLKDIEKKHQDQKKNKEPGNSKKEKYCQFRHKSKSRKEIVDKITKNRKNNKTDTSRQLAKAILKCFGYEVLQK